LATMIKKREEDWSDMSSERSGEKDYAFKAILIGDGAVGKTSLIRRYVEGKFSENYLPTIGSQIYTRTKTLVRKAEARVTLVVWDISGQTAFTKIRSEYYKGAAAILLVFDLTRPETFQHLEGWLNETRRYSPNPEIVLIGNKSDLETKRRVPFKSGEEYASKIKAPYLETSAKYGSNVEEAFTALAERLAMKAVGIQRKK